MKSHIGNVCLRLLQITRRLEVVFVAISAKTLTHDSSRTRLSAFQSQTSFAKSETDMAGWSTYIELDHKSL
ncbi:hypothetical protein Plhal304r1_c054g0139191 [Plasmopara halstedii]